MPSQNHHIMQVSELTKKVKFILESELRTVWLTGEISNFVSASSGHWYLSLKDARSQVRCAMFKGSNRYVQLKPQNGTQVLVRANVSLYEPRGDFQLIIEHMEDAGDGLLKQKFELLKTQLAAKGLFDVSHKKPLPKFVNTVGVVTSPTGAAIKDVISVLQRRQPNMKIIIYPALVQGESASVDIADMVALANQRNECDLLIVGRGGGSMEDLWAFNEVPVVNAIFNSALPVISAVGHEIDNSLADLVADVRSPTPSAAAELISQDSDQQLFQIKQLQIRLRSRSQDLIKKLSTKSDNISHRLGLAHPKRQLLMQQQKVDELQTRLTTLFKFESQNKHIKLSKLKGRLQACSPEQKLASKKELLRNLDSRLVNAALNKISQKQASLAALVQQLNIVSPLATIARGYTISRDKTGKIVKQTNQVELGDSISTQTSDGIIESQVIKIDHVG